VTFSEHTMPVTAVAFLPSGHALLSASLDGTVRAFDLMRYRNFRVLTAGQDTLSPPIYGTHAPVSKQIIRQFKCRCRYQISDLAPYRKGDFFTDTVV